MKKITALFLSILMLVSLVIPVNAAYEVTYGDTTVIFSLTSNDEDTIYAQPGDEITVNFSVLNKTNDGEAFTVETIYNDIKINNSFFEIDNSKISSSVVAYAHYQKDYEEKKWARFNGEHSQEPGGLRIYASGEVVGTFKLTVKATEGQTTLESIDPWMTDNGNIAYHIDCQNLTVIIGDTPVTLYTVKYISEGSEFATSQNAAGTITIGSAPSNGPENYQFMGWENNGTLYQPGASFELTGDTTFTAKWERIVPKYTLTFDTKGGTTYDALTLGEGSVVNLAEYTPTKANYTFEGWYSEPEYTNKVTSVTLDSNKTVYAKWKAASTGGGGGGGGGAAVTKYTITFKNADDTEIEKVQYDANATVDLGKHKPEKDGFVFEGWYTDKELKNKVTSIKLTKDTVLYANWSNKDNSPSVKPDYKPSILTDEHYAYIVGREGGMIAPESDITRAEVATIIYRLLDEDERNKAKTKENVFTDVNEDNWFNTAVSTLASLELVKGRTTETFAPNAFITRAELATIFARMVEVEYDGKVLFSDVSGHWAESYINEAATAEWIVGYNGLFRPDDNITRAEVMTLVNRVLNREPESKDDLLEGMITWKDNADENAWYYLAVQEATNSHTYNIKTDGKHEKWTSLTENPDWSKIED